MNILLINGGARAGSRTRGLTEAFERELREKGISIRIFDVGVNLLPLFTGSKEQLEQPGVQKLMSLAQKADGFVICTPEYHNGMSGSLKNALDFLGGAYFRGKPAIIGAASGGGKGGINALNNLRTVLRGLYANTLPDQIVVDPDHFDGKMGLSDPAMQERIRQMTEELQRALLAHQTA